MFRLEEATQGANQLCCSADVLTRNQDGLEQNLQDILKFTIGKYTSFGR